MQDNEFQKKYLEFQLLNEKITHLQEQHSAIENHLNELSSLLSSLDEIKKLSNNNEILIPLSNNISAKAKIGNTEKLLVGVGSNILVEKSKDEAYSLIEEQRRELSIVMKKLEEELIKIVTRIKSLQEELTNKTHQ